MRLVAVVIALVVTAWFAVGVRQSNKTQSATNLVGTSTQLPASAARRANSLLSSAGFLNPDRQVDLLRAQVDRERGRLSAARAILKPLVAAEPENVQAWLELARSSVGDATDFFTAVRRVQQLVPPVPAH